jgi:alcohol dehydrogenase (NADP+)
MESYCLTGATPSYSGMDRIDNSPTRGGYADSAICDERFVYHLPAGLDPAAAAPLLCAGITTYSPLRHWNVGPSSTVGVIGIGGLGQLGVKFAHALGAHVVAFTTSAAKADDASGCRPIS